MSCRQLIGSPYHEWLPTIREGADDALSKVIRFGEPVQLVGYRFVSWNGACTADVVIEPMMMDDGAVGARVQIGDLEFCAPSNSLPAGKRWSDMGKLAAMLSHGVRNPLNAIKGAVTYLQGRYSEEADLQEFTGIMVEEISRLEQFICGFLSTSTQGAEPELVTADSLLKKVVSYTLLQAKAAGVSIALLGDDIIPVRIDAFQFEQAVLNLVNNAMAVLDDGGHIQLSCTMLQQGGLPFAVVEVADDGPGMDPARIKELHDPASEPQLGKDRGFGLYITREVVTSYGGRLEIVSAEGQGTRVQLWLPAAKSETEAQEQS
ncbi:ATP-binding protein [Syntrophotalea acetylenivorans]|uniref:ATP-binding protein n=1 Tax=Syntrophotalea acetylenivorans TaxID=1842532 RepID=UPI001F1BEBFC|nr:HAMP domain-containing sensor histidine kinase [Syntrophotalea acetylenivorans]